MKKLLIGTAALALTGCLEAGPIHGSQHSGVRNLSVGMSMQQVSDIIGGASHKATLASGAICTSTIYDEAINAKFVHAIFEDGALVAASDGHKAVCAS